MARNEPASASSNAEAWDADVLAAQPNAHYMQSIAWAKTRVGSAWKAHRVRIKTATNELPVQIFERTAPLIGSIAFLPRVTGITVENVPAITEHFKKYPKRFFGAKVETFQPYDEALVAAFESAGWVQAASSQYQHAVMVDLHGTLEEVAARFKKRARNSYRVAERNGVTVEKVPMNAENIATMHRLIDEVKVRSGGYFRHHEYFEKIWNVYESIGQGHFYFAMYEGEVQSSAFVIRFGDIAWYKDAGSQRENNKIFAPYEMQWAIMQDLHAAGVTQYELANIPDPEEWETSNIRGLYTFKTAWAREPVKYMPTFEFPISKSRFTIWQKFGRYLRAVYTRRTGDAWY
ncbi:lipid II:glycine glycyltransferase FemX [Humidisolicoccus flavus]|uniref:lipid II:glycine glycyltransferase FemX n=1 Tax=Humidisolicoccus flavus TaxID=3111414 RepID=UPI003249D564